MKGLEEIRFFRFVPLGLASIFLHTSVDQRLNVVYAVVLKFEEIPYVCNILLGADIY